MRTISYWLILVMSCLVNGLIAQNNIPANQVFNTRQQSIIAISAFTARGDQAQLKEALHEGLDAGMTVNELREVIVQLYAYAGFPRSLNAIGTLQKLITERMQKGIRDLPGPASSKLVCNGTRFEQGKEILTKLTGSTVTGAAQQFVPLIDTLLKEHLFADIFSRELLDWKTREMVTLSALASMSGTESQLGAHFQVGLRTGLTEVELKEIVAIIQTRVGDKEAAIADRVLASVLPPTTGRGHIQQQGIVKEDANTIFPKGEKITNGNFTGNAWLQQLVLPDSSNQAMVGNVSFEPNARTNWHLHPGGQILLVLDGTGYYQEKGSLKRVLRKGDVVKCPPNVPHWHGAVPNDSFIQLAITASQNGPTIWLQPVTDLEYNGQLYK